MALSVVIWGPENTFSHIPLARIHISRYLDNHTLYDPTAGTTASIRPSSVAASYCGLIIDMKHLVLQMSSSLEVRERLQLNNTVNLVFGQHHRKHLQLHNRKYRWSINSLCWFKFFPEILTEKNVEQTVDGIKYCDLIWQIAWHMPVWSRLNLWCSVTQYFRDPNLMNVDPLFREFVSIAQLKKVG